MTPPEKYFGAAGSVLPSRSSGRQECAGPSRRAVQPNQGRPRWPPELPIKLTTPDDIDKASGALSMIRQLGGAFGIAITVALFGHFGDRATPRGFCDGFAAAMGAAALLSFVGAIAALLRKRAVSYIKAKPDIAAGRKVFEKSCATCHPRATAPPMRADTGGSGGSMTISCIPPLTTIPLISRSRLAHPGVEFCHTPSVIAARTHGSPARRPFGRAFTTPRAPAAYGWRRSAGSTARIEAP